MGAKSAPGLADVDIEAVQQAVELLTDADFQVVTVDDIDREASDEDSAAGR